MKERTTKRTYRKPFTPRRPHRNADGGPCRECVNGTCDCESYTECGMHERAERRQRRAVRREEG